MRRLATLIRSEFQLEFSTPGTWIFFLLLPLLFTFAVGAGLSNLMGDSSAPREVRPVVYVTGLPAGEIGVTLQQALRDANLDLQPVDALPRGAFGLALPADFVAHLEAGETVTVTLYLDPQSSSVMAVEQATRAGLSRIGGAVLVAHMGVAEAQRLGAAQTPAAQADFFHEVLEATLHAVQQPPVRLRVTYPQGADQAALSGPTSAQQASAGQLITWTHITLLGAAEVFVSERLRGTWRRLRLMPTRTTTLLVGKLLGRLLMGLFQMTLLIIVGELFFHVGWGRAPLATLAVSLSFALAGVSLGMLLSTLLRTRGQAFSLVIGLSMAMAALGGAWFPLEITPPLFQRIAHLIPSTWAMQAYTDILTRGASLGGVAPHVGVLCAFAVLYIALASLNLRRSEA